MKERVHVIPLVSVGEIKFGMSREEVRKKYEVYGEFKKSSFADNTTDDLVFCHVYYDNEAKKIESTLVVDEEGMISFEKSIGINYECE